MRKIVGMLGWRVAALGLLPVRIDALLRHGRHRIVHEQRLPDEFGSGRELHQHHA